MKVRFLYFKGCPYVEPALNLLKEVLKEKGIKRRNRNYRNKFKRGCRKVLFSGITYHSD